MPNYRRNLLPGGTFFFTVVTARRSPWLCRDEARSALRRAVRKVRSSLPFEIVGWVLLPDHLHCIWTLPEGDSDYSTRWRLIKSLVSRAYAKTLSDRCGSPAGDETAPSLWQPRYWEHTIRNEADLAAHLNYIHFNPVKHGYCQASLAWRFSTFRRYVRLGFYPKDWGVGMNPALPDTVGME